MSQTAVLPAQKAPANGTPAARPTVPPLPIAKPIPAPVVEEKKEPTTDGGVVEVLENIQDNLSTLAADHRQRVVEFKIAVAEGLRQALGVLDVQSERILEILKANQGLTRNVVSVARDLSKCEQSQDEVEDRATEMRERRDQLTDRLKSLNEERTSLNAQLRALTEEHRQTTDANGKLRTQVERFERETEALHTDNQKLERERDRLQADVERLTRLREEYLSNIKRLKGMHAELTQ